MFNRETSVREKFIRFMSNPLSYVQSTQDRIHVLAGLNLKIESGDRIGLIGRNGAGKTSFCRCLAGLFQPTSGHLKINGDVRAIFDTAVGIYPDLTGRDNVRILVKFLYPQHASDHAEIIRDIIEFAGLGDFIDLPFRIYSNGMQTRLCLALVTCKPCDLLILDEVFDGADQFFREKMTARMLRLADQSECVLFVSHSADQIEKLCNRVIVLERGQIQFDGNVSDGLAFYHQFGS
ncbi:MAG: ABC transporter ATP-binding protein [Bdellovibrionales bacterium]